MDVKALQHPGEFAAFIDVLRRERVTSYLEIGSKFGGSLWLVAKALPVGSLVVSVDRPKTAANSEASLRSIVDKIWAELPIRAVLIIGNSQDKGTIDKVRSYAPFDACFIDGDHSLEGVRRDWMNYGPMARIVAFHDISWKRVPEDRRIQVPEFWDRVKIGRRYEEIRLDRNNCGIGILHT